MITLPIVAFVLAAISAALFVRYIQHPEHPVVLRRRACLALAASLLCVIGIAGGIKAYKDDSPRILQLRGCTAVVVRNGETKAVDVCV